MFRGAVRYRRRSYFLRSNRNDHDNWRLFALLRRSDRAAAKTASDEALVFFEAIFMDSQSSNF
jgi:hypothetical protein